MGRLTIVNSGRRGGAERFAAWLVTGPVGHFVCGTTDWAGLMGRYLWARARRREPWVD